MNTDQGTLIVIEGIDGSGKATQFQKLVARLAAAGHAVATFDFPQYDQASSYFVRQYLSGAYGKLEDVGPYTASLFYALDRYEVAPQIRQALEQGKVVVINRYVGSSMGHQGVKFAHAEERRGYFIWLDNLEFEMLHLPRPKLSAVLRLPAETAHELLKKRSMDKPLELHEASLANLQKAVEVYDDLCQLFPKDFQRIDCTRDGQLLDVDTINDIIWQKVTPLLPAPPDPNARPVVQSGAAAVVATGTPAVSEAVIDEPPNTEEQARPDGNYHIPDTLTGDVRQLYCDIMDRIQVTRSEIAALLVDHSDPEREAALHAVLPVAASVAAPLKQSQRAAFTHAAKQLTKNLLPANYATATATLQLATVWPRNELDLVADIVYAASDLPLRDLQHTASTWPYEVKAKLLEAHLEQNNASDALARPHYAWDILCEFATLLHLQAAAPQITLEHQTLTPRYGYAVPKIIEDADLVEQFETCFDLSLQLHSSLQEAGFAHEAQYAVLLGHKVQAVLRNTVADARQLYAATPPDENTRALLDQLHEKLAEVHPMLAAYMHPKASKDGHFAEIDERSSA